MSIDKFTIPVLITSNYSAWATQIEHILCVHGVWEVVSGTEEEPKEDDPKYGSEADQEPTFDFEQDSKAYKAKVARANATVFANMSQTIVEEHKKYKVPSVLWQTLQKRYAPRTTVSRISAGCDFANACSSVHERRFRVGPRIFNSSSTSEGPFCGLRWHY